MQVVPGHAPSLLSNNLVNTSVFVENDFPASSNILADQSHLPAVVSGAQFMHTYSLVSGSVQSPL